MDIFFYHASGEASTGLVGGVFDSTRLGASSFFIGGIVGGDVVAPPEGSGDLWVYSKHYVNITGYDSNTGAQNVRVSVLYADHSDQLYLATALTHEEGITGAYHYGPQTGLPWSSTPPTFVKGQGWGEGVLLTNGTTDPGGFVPVATGVSGGMGFWVARRFKQNYIYGTATNNIHLGIEADPA